MFDNLKFIISNIRSCKLLLDLLKISENSIEIDNLLNEYKSIGRSSNKNFTQNQYFENEQNLPIENRNEDSFNKDDLYEDISLKTINTNSINDIDEEDYEL